MGAFVLAMGSTGCKRAATDDASLTQAVQNKLSSDTALAGEPIRASVEHGIVTLDGTVGNEAARSLASSDVARVPGVTTVVNDLTVAARSTPVTASIPPEPRHEAQTFRPAPTQPAPARPAPVRKMSARPDAAVQQVQPEESVQSQPAPIERPARESQAVDLPAPAPAPRNLTLPSGSTLAVRLNQTLDSATTQTGDQFSGSLASDILVDGVVLLPQGTPVSGRVDEVREAAHFKGSSLLTIELTSIDRRGGRIPITSDSFSKAGDGRGKNSAEKIGGGAAVGAILGGIFGGGKGAAIGAAAGGGAGTGVQGITKGQQVQIPAESLVRFHLANDVIVRVSQSDRSGGPEGDLQRH